MRSLRTGSLATVGVRFSTMGGDGADFVGAGPRLSSARGAAERSESWVSSVAESTTPMGATAATGAVIGASTINRYGPTAALRPGSRTTDGTRDPETQIPFWLPRSTSV